MSTPPEIPHEIDFTDPAAAREWTDAVTARRPYREDFFRLFVSELRSLGSRDLSVLDIGSGPGYLARTILEAFPNVRYSAVDYSPAMHSLARERLGPLAERVTFLTLDYAAADWNSGLPQYDVIVSIQAIHEVRHKSHIPALYKTLRSLLKRGGTLLACDILAGPEGSSNTELHMTVEEQQAAIKDAGFSSVRKLLQKSALVLWRAEAP